MKFIKWFYPGLKIKRWILMLLLGISFMILGGARFFINQHVLVKKIVDTSTFALGVIFFTLGTKHVIKSFFEVILPPLGSNWVDIIYQKRYLEKGPKIVAIGGGTGLSSLLSGVKEYTTNITAIVTVSDEGGSSGRLREEFDILPPGDLRNCLVALADMPGLMGDLFQFRFNRGEGFKGHSFGNLFITAMTELNGGNFDKAIKESSKVLAIRGQVVPASLDKIRLKAEFQDGSVTEGEVQIPRQAKRIKKLSLIPESPKANPEALQAIKNADIIVMGPGSLYTSILPNVLIKEIAEEIHRSKALKIYVCNVMTQAGETDGFTASKHVEVLFEYTVPKLVQVCILNSGGIDSEILFRYAQEKSFPVLPDKKRLEKMGVVPLEDDLLNKENYVRHHPQKLAKKIIDSYQRWKIKRIKN